MILRRKQENSIIIDHWMEYKLCAIQSYIYISRLEHATNMKAPFLDWIDLSYG